jgi:DNA-binding LacI/PurR family transcriptional regulator
MTQGRAPSQKDVAELAGVSSQTVSRVVNNSPKVDQQTRERVLSAMRILGYWTNGAARALATGQSRSVGVISFDLSLYGNARTIEAITAAAQDADYSVTVVGISAATEESVQRAYARLASQAIDGVVLIEARILDTATVHLPTSVPVVIADGDPNTNFPAIDTDQAAGARVATEHLLGLGHETVWHVAGPHDSHAARRRAAAWRATLKEAGRPVPPVLFGDWSAESGLAAGRELAAMKGAGEAGGVTAIFAANDHMALGVLRALHEAGRRVPDEVSVVGFDDVPEASCYLPPLTTVHQNVAEAGRRCVALLLDQISSGGPSGPGEVSAIQPRLIERASTAPLQTISPRTLTDKTT